MQEKQLDQKYKVNFKTHNAQPSLQTSPIRILPNISQSDGKQIMKFGQLIEYYKRNMFPQKLLGK